MVKERIKKVAGKLKHVRIRKLYLDYVAGLLSIPILIMGIFINWGNLHKSPAPGSQSVSPSPQVIVVSQSASQPHYIPQATCTKSIGPIAITSPQDGKTVTDNPVCITITYSDSTYCSVVWSYRINKGTWSDFNNTSPCLYNLPNGPVVVDVRINSTVSSDTKTLSRSFIYSGASVTVTPTVTPTLTTSPTPVASSSAN